MHSVPTSCLNKVNFYKTMNSMQVYQIKSSQVLDIHSGIYCRAKSPQQNKRKRKCEARTVKYFLLTVPASRDFHHAEGAITRGRKSRDRVGKWHRNRSRPSPRPRPDPGRSRAPVSDTGREGSCFFTPTAKRPWEVSVLSPVPQAPARWAGLAGAGLCAPPQGSLTLTNGEPGTA